MKIIFLDMDGVLCTLRSHMAQGSIKGIWHMAALDREAIGLLNRLSMRDVKWVLSSTWRLHWTKEEMERHLKSFGWTGTFHEDWRTKQLNGIRGLEIREWLDRHVTEYETYAILDDNSDMLPEQMDAFVQTHVYDGLRWEDYDKLCKVLGEGH